ncbi:MFS transporter [Mycolicibacterium sp. CH28]|uniref:MFS transporter n=1 Tax=Mycolicibacterium sp. CH28 TaxID=2512237 RepID=UPI00107FEBF9|nr:MFS transporter [Mycolicibacterium sp. CH28]TGD87510.1 MFS transporter [Mycolicibacterium sp. CH28]
MIVLAATAVGRLPVTAFSVLFVVQSKMVFDRYDAGGLATLCYMVGATINSATAGHWLVRWNQGRVVLVTGVVCATTLVVAALPNHISTVRFCALAGLIGLTYPPLHVASRSLYPKLLPAPALLRFYSWDVSLVQISWIVVPVSAIVLLRPVGVTGLYLALAATMLVGAGWYLRTLRRLGGRAARMSSPQFGSEPATPSGIHRDPTFYIYLLAAGLVLFSSGLILPGLVSVLGSDSRRSLAVLLWSIGSALGSLIVNRPTIRRLRVVGLLCTAIVLLLGTFTLQATRGPLLMPVLISLLVLGTSTAPVTGAVFYQISQRFAGVEQPHAFGWITSIQLISEGLGAAISGVLLDRDAAFWVAVLIVGALLALAALLAINPRGTFSMPSLPRSTCTSTSTEEDHA